MFGSVSWHLFCKIITECLQGPLSSSQAAPAAGLMEYLICWDLVNQGCASERLELWDLVLIVWSWMDFQRQFIWTAQLARGNNNASQVLEVERRENLLCCYCRGALLHLRLDAYNLDIVDSVRVKKFPRAIHGSAYLHLLPFTQLLQALDIVFHPLAIRESARIGIDVFWGWNSHLLINVLQTAVDGALRFRGVLFQQDRPNELVNLCIVVQA